MLAQHTWHGACPPRCAQHASSIVRFVPACGHTLTLAADSTLAISLGPRSIGSADTAEWAPGSPAHAVDIAEGGSTHLGDAVFVLVQVFCQLLDLALHSDAQRLAKRRLDHREDVGHEQVIPFDRHARRCGNAEAVAVAVHGGRAPAARQLAKACGKEASPTAALSAAAAAETRQGGNSH